MNFLLAGPLGVIDCILLVIAVARITHKRIQELRDPTLGSFLAALFSASVSVASITLAATVVLMFLIFASLDLLPFGHRQNLGTSFILFFVVVQVSAFAGVIAAYFAGPSFSRFIWEESAASSDESGE